jgi:hypothetical protein
MATNTIWYGVLNTIGHSGTLSGGSFNHQTINTPRWMKSSLKEVFWEVLRNVERTSGPDYFEYDEDAFSIMDYRKDPSEIPLLALASFCLCNHFPLSALVQMLEGSGVRVAE